MNKLELKSADSHHHYIIIVLAAWGIDRFSDFGKEAGLGDRIPL